MPQTTELTIPVILLASLPEYYVPVLPEKELPFLMIALEPM